MILPKNIQNSNLKITVNGFADTSMLGQYISFTINSPCFIVLSQCFLPKDIDS